MRTPRETCSPRRVVRPLRPSAPVRSFLRRAMVLVACLGMSAGCSSMDERVDPRYDLRGSDVYVVPFALGNFWHCDSAEGNTLAQMLEIALTRECGGTQTVRDPEVFRRIQGDLSDRVDWLQYGRDAGVTFLVVGEIEELSLSSRQRLGMWTGVLRARYQVWNIVEGTRGYASSIEARFPAGPDSGRVVISFEEGREEVERALLAEAAKKITADLCGYLPETPM